MYTFKRGFSHAVIHSLTFGSDKLVCSSDSGTLHVFLLDKHVSGLTTGDVTEDTEESKDESGASWRVGTMIKSVISSVVPKDYEEALSRL